MCIRDKYPHIVGWETIPAWPHPTQFIPGGHSPYVTDAYRDALLAQFLSLIHISADRVDEQMRAWRDRQGQEKVWHTRDAILLCICLLYTSRCV